MKLAVSLASAVMFTLAVAPASAHEDYNRHERDHRKHEKFHTYTGRVHARAHAEGFDSWQEHRAFHRSLKRRHHNFHDDHPYTRHDHYDWRR